MDSLLNWLWQGSVVALAATALLAVTRAPARARYLAAATALMTVLLLPLVTLGVAWSRPAAGPIGPVTAETALVAIPAHWWTSDGFVLALWSVWASVIGIRWCLGQRAVARARLASTAFPSDVEQRLPQWRRVRRRGRRARLVLSSDVRTAAVFGGKSPLIAVAPKLVATLHPDDLDRIVMHEWAHVHWRDDRAHLLQAWVRVLAGWHPAVWWLERQLHFEREVACDEQAILLTGSPKAYAGCLATLAGFRTTGSRELSIVNAGAGSQLRRRVRRVLAFRVANQPIMRLAAGCAGLLPVVLAYGIADIQLVAPALGVGTTVRARERAPEASPRAAQRHEPDARRMQATAPITPVRRPPSAVRRTADLVQPLRSDAPQLDAADGPAEYGGSEAQTSPRPAIESLSGTANWSLAGLRDGSTVAPVAPGDHTSTASAPTLWNVAATSGAAIGRGSQKAAVSTAGFFSRVGRTVARSF